MLLSSDICIDANRAALSFFPCCWIFIMLFRISAEYCPANIPSCSSNFTSLAIRPCSSSSENHSFPSLAAPAGRSSPSLFPSSS
uniref:Uncharacterized protein n=1 Tax=Arundo donax TaxID=35708 RepID=A0A0A9F2E0_ARUDO